MYVYQAETYCDSCGARIAAELDAGPEPIALRDDSDHYPQGPYPEEETDGPNHCDSQSECLEGIDLTAYGPIPELHGAEARTIGAPTNDGLTEEGVRYLREMLADRPRTPYQVALHRYWQELYSDELAAV